MHNKGVIFAAITKFTKFLKPACHHALMGCAHWGNAASLTAIGGSLHLCRGCVFFHWHEGRTDNFVSPIVRGMPRRVKPEQRSRDRTLTDDELRRVWRAADESDEPFPALVQFLLLTGARLNEAARMRWDEIDGEDWLLPAVRHKTKNRSAQALKQSSAGRDQASSPGSVTAHSSSPSTAVNRLTTSPRPSGSLTRRAACLTVSGASAPLWMLA
jgi:integrase